MATGRTSRPSLEKGTLLNAKWEIIEHIATGGMAEIYRARQIALDREVAVKVLSDEFLLSFEGDEEEIAAAIERFRREVKMMAQVRHANVLQVYDHDRAGIGTEGPEQIVEYIAMEYIPGPNLRFTMREEGFGDDERATTKWIRTYMLPILDGMEVVHAMGIVHRDLKPENVLLDGPTPKIADFGLAGGARWHRVTRSHHIGGTIPYQSGEQFLDMGGTDPRADVYSLGKILYEAITGKMTKDTALPFKTARLPKARTRFAKRLDQVVQKATAEEKGERTPSAGALREALLEALGETEGGAASVKKRSRRRTAIWVSSVLGLAALAATTLVIHLTTPHQEPFPAPQPTPERAGPQPTAPDFEPKGALGLRSPATSTTPAPDKLQGKDGATLRLVPGGTVVLPAGLGGQAGRTMEVRPFYMDEAEVTTHQFVEFLNQNLSRTEVGGGTVRGDREIWLLLGEVRAGYEPIVFMDGRFRIKDPTLASHPVVRVTAQGAQAYARFQERRLPTEAEWLHAFLNGKGPSPARPLQTPPPTAGPGVPSTGQEGMEGMHAQMMQRSEATGRGATSGPTSVDAVPADGLGLRGMDENAREWAARTPSLGKAGEPGYVVLPTAVPRLPWEAFEDVGFRCAASP